MPLPSLSEMSTMQRSGLVVSISLRASLTLPAAPQTKRSPCIDSSAVRPSHTTGWASTITTRVNVLRASGRLLLMALAPGAGTGARHPRGGPIAPRDGRPSAGLGLAGGVPEDLEAQAREDARLGARPHAV